MRNVPVFQMVLCNNTEKLTVCTFKRLYRVDYSPEGSHNKIEEKETIYSFELFLQDLYENVLKDFTLEDVLTFITGANAVPSLGFYRLICIGFYSQEIGRKRLPWSSTCSMSLIIPRNVGDPDVFCGLLKQSLTEWHGFGKI